MRILDWTGRLLALAALASLTTVATMASTSELSAKPKAKTKRISAPKLRGILKKAGERRVHFRADKKRRVHFNTKRRGPGAGYSPTRKRVVRKRVRTGKLKSLMARRGEIARKARVKRTRSRKVRANKSLLNRRGHLARSARKVKRGNSVRRGSRAARHAAKARRLRNTARAAKLARGAKLLAAGTGVGAVAAVAASAAGVDPTELAALKVTNPAEYRRRMRDLKKNPVKYMGRNVKNNVGKVGRGIKNGGRKIGKGVKKLFAKRKKKRSRRR